jgi:hypothetical protein
MFPSCSTDASERLARKAPCGRPVAHAPQPSLGSPSASFSPAPRSQQGPPLADSPQPRARDCFLAGSACDTIPNTQADPAPLPLRG